MSRFTKDIAVIRIRYKKSRGQSYFSCWPYCTFVGVSLSEAEFVGGVYLNKWFTKVCGSPFPGIYAII